MKFKPLSTRTNTGEDSEKHIACTILYRINEKLEVDSVELWELPEAVSQHLSYFAHEREPLVEDAMGGPVEEFEQSGEVESRSGKGIGRSRTDHRRNQL
uniref:Uncharacterized protein n=1 Tax=Pristionchus pacificus TaxID=54126 RepID=A0A2A6CNC0_PRIPA|eukprot:PDM79600.1 hypothetical protein PRIPAC_32179 [Pristionchus pacificus]